jgi:hypothetical protein
MLNLNTAYKITFIIAGLIMISCTTKKQNIAEELSNSNSEVEKSKENKKKDPIELTPLKVKYTVAKGQKLEYTASVHGSVGATTKVSADDESIIKLIDTKHKYTNPSKSKMPGGDAATVKYTFEAMKSGVGHVIIEKSFRGDLENRYELEITVE